ncbi:Uncharacterized conserved protein, NAD-dependent epimerase/dehydratase family [Muriicola jejuensis]|uniref:DUF1611 domain-containing protein n=1 Tax=Muriicola jejuensis TaxID=504488 RepID=A0A6P0U7J2_9FLAO|nr:DUF1611 domain-containing protein [Muriicola jejuensis]NER09095.1 DUF1611 domain-containing protein [Muriicola jejuensis]SMP11237.1 Uncharacterized conserved protein, NAD-dependent epimerase/dehydratase family [Muriicola jejuensis]
MKKSIDGNALVYCEGAFNTPNGKTAHGLVRFTERYNVVGVIDSRYAGKDAGEVLDGKANGIPIFEDLLSAVKYYTGKPLMPESLVIGLAPDGGRLPAEARKTIAAAMELGWNVDSGLHDFLTNDTNLVDLARKKGCRIRDIRKTPDRDKLHFFTGEIEKVDCLKLAILGTDSAIGKRTTAWILVHGLRKAGLKAEMVGTGQTAWMQGAKYSMVMDSCINDFVSGEIEHAVVSAWKHENPDVIVIEGQGSLMNPAYPGGFEILAAGRPDYIILQHAPMRHEYDGFPGYRLHSLPEQIHALEVISGKKVIAITVNHENMKKEEIAPACKAITDETGIPAFDVLEFGSERLVDLVKNNLKK